MSNTNHERPAIRKEQQPAESAETPEQQKERTTMNLFADANLLFHFHSLLKQRKFATPAELVNALKSLVPIPAEKETTIEQMSEVFLQHNEQMQAYRAKFVRNGEFDEQSCGRDLYRKITGYEPNGALKVRFTSPWACEMEITDESDYELTIAPKGLGFACDVSTKIRSDEPENLINLNVIRATPKVHEKLKLETYWHEAVHARQNLFRESLKRSGQNLVKIWGPMSIRGDRVDDDLLEVVDLRQEKANLINYLLTCAKEEVLAFMEQGYDSESLKQSIQCIKTIDSYDFTSRYFAELNGTALTTEIRKSKAFLAFKNEFEGTLEQKVGSIVELVSVWDDFHVPPKRLELLRLMLLHVPMQNWDSFLTSTKLGEEMSLMRQCIEQYEASKDQSAYAYYKRLNEACVQNPDKPWNEILKEWLTIEKSGFQNASNVPFVENLTERENRYRARTSRCLDTDTTYTYSFAPPITQEEFNAVIWTDLQIGPIADTTDNGILLKISKTTDIAKVRKIFARLREGKLVNIQIAHEKYPDQELEYKQTFQKLLEWEREFDSNAKRVQAEEYQVLGRGSSPNTTRPRKTRVLLGDTRERSVPGWGPVYFEPPKYNNGETVLVVWNDGRKARIEIGEGVSKSVDFPDRPLLPVYIENLLREETLKFQPSPPANDSANI